MFKGGAATRRGRGGWVGALPRKAGPLSPRQGSFTVKATSGPPPRLLSPQGASLGAEFSIIVALTVLAVPALSRGCWGRREPERQSRQDPRQEAEEGAPREPTWLHQPPCLSGELPPFLLGGSCCVYFQQNKILKSRC